MHKLFFILIFLFFTISCHRNPAFDKTVSSESLNLKSDCPEEKNCKLVLLKNQSLDIRAINNSLLYEIKKNASTDVVKYEYSKNTEQAEHDGGYREELLFEIPHGDFEQNLIDSDLQNSKMVFGRYCFCRGNTGLFKVVNGNLKINSKSKQIHFDLNFKINQVPQITHIISH